MLTTFERAEIKKLLQEGFSIPYISRMTGRSTTTIYHLQKNNDSAQENDSDGESCPKKLHGFITYLNGRLKSGITNTSKLLLELKSQGYSGSYSTIHRYIKEREGEAPLKERLIRPNHRFETGPGEQAQVDWCTYGKIYVNDRPEKLYCFVYVLGYSRAIYIEFAVKQNLQTFEQCHIHAFEKLGIPKTILYDNTKTVVIRRERVPQADDIIHYNPAFLDFASYYGFLVQVCPPYWPRSKGKVEAGVKYVQNDFMQGMQFNKEFKSLEDLNGQALVWAETVANQRIHRTTGEKPFERWLHEKQSLHMLDQRPAYQTSPFTERNSTQDGMVQYKSNLYSVPIDYSRRKLFIKEINNNGLITLEIYHEDDIIATHPLSQGRGGVFQDDKHLVSSVQGKQNEAETNQKKPKGLKDLQITTTRGLSYYDELIPNAKNG